MARTAAAALSFSGMLLFTTFIVVGVANVRRLDVHRRAMTLAAFSIIQPAVARLIMLAPQIAQPQRIVIGAVIVDLLLLGVVLLDRRTIGRPSVEQIGDLRRALDRSIGDGNRFDLDHGVPVIEGAHFDDRVGRVGREEVLAAQLDDLLEVRHVGEEDRHFDDVAQARPAGAQGALQVRERLVRLSLEVAGRYDPAGVVVGSLT
jgi:hypothetical protein